MLCSREVRIMGPVQPQFSDLLTRILKIGSLSASDIVIVDIALRPVRSHVQMVTTRERSPSPHNIALIDAFSTS